jgi:hypothetical protein
LAAVIYLKDADLYIYGDSEALDALDNKFLTSMLTHARTTIAMT